MVTAGSQPLDGGHVSTVGLDGEHQARQHGVPVNQDGARAAGTGLACWVDACHADLVAKQVAQQHPRFDVDFVRALVDLDDGLHPTSSPPLRIHAVRTASAITRRAISRRYCASAWMSSGGSIRLSTLPATSSTVLGRSTDWPSSGAHGSLTSRVRSPRLRAPAPTRSHTPFRSTTTATPAYAYSPWRCACSTWAEPAIADFRGMRTA